MNGLFLLSPSAIQPKDTPKKLVKTLSRSVRTPLKWTISRLEDLVPPPPKEERNVNDDFQVQVLIKYHGDIHMTITTEFLVNKPFPRFLTLPITLRVVNGDFFGHGLVAFVGKDTCFCLYSEDSEKG